jgi:feruloyl esterase
LLNYPKTKPEYISNQLLSAVTAEMIKQCDPQDGVVDQIVSDPFGCNFDYEALLCRGGANSASPCLTPGQLETVYKAYSDWVDANQTYVFPGLALGADSSFLLGSVNSLGYDLYRYFVYNSSTWDYTRFTYEDVLFADTVDPGDAAADDFDLSPYHRRGGKILKYHGGADSLIPTGSSVHFRKRVEQTLAPMGVDLDDFYRFFLVPDMGHCSGSARGPWYISAGQQSVRGATHSVPGFEDEEHDAILALMAWVEGGTAPEKIIATKFVGDDAAAGVQSQRPLCPYPKQAKYISGDVDAPGSWECQSLY